MSLPVANTFPVINAASMGADITGSPTEIERYKTAGLHFIWSGGTGAWVIEVSNSDADYRGTTNNWVDITSLIAGTLTNPAGSAGKDVLGISDLGFKYLRVRYARTSGTGTATVLLTWKGV